MGIEGDIFIYIYIYIYVPGSIKWDPIFGVEIKLEAKIYGKFEGISPENSCLVSYNDTYWDTSWYLATIGSKWIISSLFRKKSRL